MSRAQVEKAYRLWNRPLIERIRQTGLTFEILWLGMEHGPWGHLATVETIGM